MPGKKAKKPVSKAQARLYGAVAGGNKSAAPGLSMADAKRKLKGVKVSKLPAKKMRKR